MSNTNRNDLLLAINGMNAASCNLREYAYMRAAIPRRDPTVIMMDIVRTQEQLLEVVTLTPTESTFKVSISDRKKAERLTTRIEILKEEFDHANEI